MDLRIFVDDIRTPEMIYPGESGWVLCRTITEAIRLLATTEISAISLDHDIQCGATLGDNGLWSGGHTSPETYEPIAWYLDMMLNAYEMDECSSPIKKITLHSANPVGRKKMREILDENCSIAGVELTELPGCAAAHVE